jgi:hypothetical protein
LYPSRIVGNAVVNTSEKRVRDNRRRIIKRGVIQDVSRIKAQIEIDGFGYSEFLGKRGIPLEIPGREKEITSRASN